MERPGDAAGRREFVLKYSKNEGGREGHMPLSLCVPWKLIKNQQAVAVATETCRLLSKLNLGNLADVTAIRNPLVPLNYWAVNHIFSEILQIGTQR